MKMITKPCFVAFDGKIFHDEDKCLEYENSFDTFNFPFEAYNSDGDKVDYHNDDDVCIVVLHSEFEAKLMANGMVAESRGALKEYWNKTTHANWNTPLYAVWSGETSNWTIFNCADMDTLRIFLSKNSIPEY